MKWKHKSLMFLILMLFCVGSVCATDPDNSTTDKISIEDSNGFNADIIHSFTDPIIQNDPDVKELKKKVNNQSIEIEKLKEDNIEKDIKVNNQSIEIKQLKKDNKQLYKIIDGLSIRINNLEIKTDGLYKIIKSHEERISFLEKENKELKAEIKETREEMKKMKEMNKCMFKIQENYERLLDNTISPDEKLNIKNEIKDLKTKNRLYK